MNLNKKLFHQFINQSLQYILPIRCVICDEYLKMLDESEWCPPQICYECWNKLEFISPISCKKCGSNIDFDGADCRHCEGNLFSFHQAKACIVYNDDSQKLFFQLKHNAHDSIISMMGKWLHHRYKTFDQSHDAIVSMPLSPWRLFTRGFNQSAYLVFELQKMLNHPLQDLSSHIERIKNTPPQGHKGTRDRYENVKGAFKACDSIFQNKTILLIDDIFTSGASFEACSQELLCKGAKRVDVLAVGRTQKK